MDSVDDIPDLEQIEFLSVDTLSRRDVRSLIYHLLYAMESHDYQVSLESIVDMFNRGCNLDIKKESDLFKTADGVIVERVSLDALVVPFLHNWRFERLSVATKLILRMAIWELVHTETAPGIIINEAIELTKCFAEDDAYKFVNGVLDEYAKSTGRVVEDSNS